jgi:hypothetical protein
MWNAKGFSLGIRFFLSGNFRLLWESYLLNHFFRDIIPKKGIFEFLNQFTHFKHQIKFIFFSQSMPRPFGSFFPNLRIWIKGLGTARHVSSMVYFSNFLEDKERRFKTNLTINLILRFNLRLGGYSIWSASLIAPRIKEDLQTAQGMSTSQSHCSQEITRKTPSRRSSGELKDAFISTRKPAVLNYEELRAYQIRGHGTAHIAYIFWEKR